MSDAITLLTADHRLVEQLFQQFDETADPAVATEICFQLTVHGTVEEELLYGLYSAKVDNAGAAEARAEHQGIKDLVLAVEGMGPAGDELVATVGKLKAAVQHHVEHEERVMFPTLLERLPETAAILGADIATRREVVEAQVRASREIGTSPSTTGQ